jgi:D-alanyl-D-alanine endopeptidase (penicillin-binding protein 7)
MKRLFFSIILLTSTLSLAQPLTHTVVKGDTLYGIAASYNTSVKQLINYNNLSNATIKPGQVLNITPAVNNRLANENHIYTVKRGDSLFTIAGQYNISVKSLKSVNGLRNSLLMPGQKLRIPSSTYVDTSSPIAAIGKSTPETNRVHKVKRGESLWEIAKRHGVSLSALRSANQLSQRSLIKPGQTLIVPLDNGSLTSNHSSNSYQNSVKLYSQSALVVDAETGAVLYAKNANQIKPIASITKLMTAMVTLDSNLAMNETLVIDRNDIDRIKKTGSRLPMGTKLSRQQMLHLALMSSENRAASALSRHYPGGQIEFIRAMNKKAKALGMHNTHFFDPTGLTPKNVSTAEDLVKMVQAASNYPLIHKFTTATSSEVTVRPRTAPLQYRNSNLLVQKGQWNIDVSKTGYINEAGRCLVMKAEIANRPAVMVFLKSDGKYTPVGDATRIKKWIESGSAPISVAAR